MSVLQSYWRCAEIILIGNQKRRAKIFATGEIGGKWNPRMILKDGYEKWGAGGSSLRVGKQHDKYLVSLGAAHIIT